MNKPPSLKVALLWGCLIGLPIGSVWLGGWAAATWRAVEDWQMKGRFAQLEVALLRYHDEHGAFPPTRYQPEPGGPIHNWRVLLLPYLDRKFVERHGSYDYSHWWIYPGNLDALGREAPALFRAHRKAYPGITHYLAIGEDDEWPSRRLLQSRLVKRGDDRFLLVEHPASQIHWMEPKY